MNKLLWEYFKTVLCTRRRKSLASQLSNSWQVQDSRKPAINHLKEGEKVTVSKPHLTAVY